MGRALSDLALAIYMCLLRPVLQALLAVGDIVGHEGGVDDSLTKSLRIRCA